MDANGVTAKVAVLLLFPELGSTVAELMIAVLLMLPVAAGLTFATSVKTAEGPKARLGFVAVTSPVEPTGGVGSAQPAGADKLTNVILAGSASLRTTLAAAVGPEFVTMMV